MILVEWVFYKNWLIVLALSNAEKFEFHLVYSFKYLVLFCLPAIRPGSTSAMAPVFHITIVIAINLQTVVTTKEGLSTVP